jgi:hypothetical protein
MFKHFYEKTPELSFVLEENKKYKVKNVNIKKKKSPLKIGSDKILFEFLEISNIFLKFVTRIQIYKKNKKESIEFDSNKESNFTLPQELLLGKFIKKEEKNSNSVWRQLNGSAYIKDTFTPFLI